MKTKMALLCFASVLGFLATGGTVYENYVAREAKSALATTLQQREALQRELRLGKSTLMAGEQAAEKAEQMRDALKKRIDELLTEQKAVATKASNAALPAPTTSNDFTRLIATNPEYQKLYRKECRLRDGVAYARLYRRLALSPDQIAAFEEARFVRQQAEDDITAVAFEKGISETDPVFKPIRKQARDECDAKICETLGTEGYAAYKAYPKEMLTDSRREVELLAAALFDTKTPFTVEQADALAHVITANSIQSKTANQKTNWEAVYVQARGILSEPQLAELKRTNEIYRRRLMMYEITDKPGVKAP